MKLGVPAGITIRLPYCRRMTIAGKFITDLQAERKIGNVSYETEQHLKHEFRRLGRDAAGPTLARVVEIRPLLPSRTNQRSATVPATARSDRPL